MGSQAHDLKFDSSKSVDWCRRRLLDLNYERKRQRSQVMWTYHWTSTSHHLLIGFSTLKPPPVKLVLLLRGGRASSWSSCSLVLTLFWLMTHTGWTQQFACPTEIRSNKGQYHLWSFFWLRYFFLMLVSSSASLWFSHLYSLILWSSTLTCAVSTCKNKTPTMNFTWVFPELLRFMEPQI